MSSTIGCSSFLGSIARCISVHAKRRQRPSPAFLCAGARMPANQSLKLTGPRYVASRGHVIPAAPQLSLTVRQRRAYLMTVGRAACLLGIALLVLVANVA